MIFAKKENIKFFRVKLNHRPEPVYTYFRKDSINHEQEDGHRPSRSVRLLSMWSVKLAPNPDSRHGNPGRSRVHFIMAVAGVAAVVSSGRDPS